MATSHSSIPFDRLEGSWLSSSVEAVRPDLRVSWIIRRLKDGIGTSNNHLSVRRNIINFMRLLLIYVVQSGGRHGPPRLIFLYQRVENATGDIDENSYPELVLSDGSNVRFRGKCMYFLKCSRQLTDRDARAPELDLVYGETLSDTLQCLHMTISRIFQPCLALAFESQDWGKASQSDIKEYLEDLAKFNEMLADAASSMQGGIQLRKLEKKYMVENKQQAYIRASQDTDILVVYENVMDSWCIQCEQLLAESGESNDTDDMSGPDTEFEFWRNRMAKFNSIAEQLKQKEHRCVIGVVAQNKNNVPSPTYKRWKVIDNLITDTLNEAKDNVKYLSALEKYTECLYTGTPQTIIEALPALMSNIKMMFTIARYYGTTERMTKLFTKITNQMIVNSKNSINRPILNGAIVRLWDQDVSNLLERLKSTTKLYEVYQSLYRMTKEKLALQPKGKQFDFSESVIFDKFDQFCKRLQKLVSMFTTIQQFSSLAVSRIEGMESLIQSFSDIMTEFKRKPYDLLDYTKNAFNRDYLEYTVNIGELEQQVQKFINRSFDNIISTEQSLELLRTFEKLLVRDVLRADLESKYDVIFQNYGQDLETVQWLYEKYKASPPMVRNMPPVIGNILWAQQLLHRVEDPMRRFKSSTSLMQNSKDAKRIIKNYNKVARALIEFETLWHNAWMKSVEAARSGLQATLIIRHPRTNRLFVNFDREILQLVREAKGLQRVQVEIPENARMVLVHEDKLKSYYNQLSFALKEYDRVLNMIVPVVRPLLKPHLDDLDMKIQPGMVQLTWLSMNIDGYLQKIHSGLSNLEELARKVNDIVEQRIDRNLKIVSKSLLVDLPSNQSFTLEQFVQLQEKATKIVTTMLDSKNREIEQAVSDVMQLISSYPLEAEQAVPQDEIDSFWKHHGKVMYLSVLRCTKQSFFALKNRLSSRTSRGLFWVERPFFDVDVELAPPSVTMNPSLDEIQISINRCALNILRCSKRIFQWSKVTRSSSGEDNSYHYLIGQDYQIVAVCLMLTGAVDSVKKQVIDYLQTFMKYDFLWKNSKDMAYNSFIRTNPSLENFDQEMQSYQDIELKINDIPTLHNLGCLCLHTGPLKSSLQKEALSWKLLYGENLHQQAHTKVSLLIDYFKDVEQRLDREISDLDHAQEMLAVLKEVRDRETEMDMQISPIHAQYQLLLKHDIQVDEGELEQVFNLASLWMKVLQKSRNRNDDLYKKQEALWLELNNSVAQFEKSVLMFRDDFLVNGPMTDNLSPLEAAERMKKFKALFQGYQNRWNKFVDGMILFGKPIKNIPELTVTEQELELLDQLYSLYISVLDSMNSCKMLRWSDYANQMNLIESTMQTYKLRCSNMPKILREWRAYTELEVVIDEFLAVCPILRALSGRAVRQRHWRSIQDKLASATDMDVNTLKVENVLNMGLAKLRVEIEDVCAAAVKEQAIETKLDTLKKDWAEFKFEFQNFKNRGPVVLKANVLSDILERCEESTISLSGMIGNKYSEPFRDIVQSWSIKLSSVGDVVELLSVVQPLWIHMESVFSGADIAKQLPLEAKRFSELDKKYMKLISRAFEFPQVFECCSNDEMKIILPNLKIQLELCQKSLSGYLESKRLNCPRFYFISDKLLLESLCEGTDLAAISLHLKYLFHSLSSFSLSADQRNCVTSIITEQLEEMTLAKVVECRSSIEEFLIELEASIHFSVKNLIQDCLIDPNVPIKNLIDSYPSQICALSCQILWTYKIEDAIQRVRNDKNAMPLTSKRFQSSLKDLLDIISKQIGQAQRRSAESLIVLQIYYKETLDDFIKKKVKDVSDFDWQRLRRFYWDTGAESWESARQPVEGPRKSISVPNNQENLQPGNCVLNVVDESITHSYELICIKQQLVITPLVNRCVVSLVQALKSNFCGALISPAGVGKSELLKDLGAAVGKYITVFTGSKLMCSQDLAKFLKGLAMSGFWGLFDNFERLTIPLLSLAAHQILWIITAQREKRKDFSFGDVQNIPLHPSCSFFLTSNRYDLEKSKLPENLKALLRCVGMSTPVFSVIARVKLASFGFEESVSLAKKLDCLYSLSKDMLLRHQDSFTLREGLVVLQCVGKLKVEMLDKQEKQVLVQVLQDVYYPRLNDAEVRIFANLLNELFPGSSPEINMAEKRGKESSKLAAERIEVNFVSDPFAASLLPKAVQVENLMRCHHCIAVVGSAGVGKSIIIEFASNLFLNNPTRHGTVKIFPLCLTIQQLIGGIQNPSTEWEDGIFPVLWRKLTKSTNSPSWIVFDGTIGPWAELFLSVIDSDKTFTIGSGERMKMTDNMRLIFESDSFSSASPGIIVRLGFAFVQNGLLGWETLLTKWIANRPEKQSVYFKSLFSKTLPGLLRSLKANQSLGAWSFFNMIEQMLSMVSLVLEGSHSLTDLTDIHLGRTALFSVCWSIGGIFDEDGRKALDTIFRKVFDVEYQPPQDSSCYNYYLRGGEWVAWKSTMNSGKHFEDLTYNISTLVVPTVESSRILYLLNLFTASEIPCMLTGSAGVGKSLLAAKCLAQLRRLDFSCRVCQFSYATKPQTFQSYLEGGIERRQGHSYGALDNKRRVCFMDDIHLPEATNTELQVNELIRQLLQEKGFFDQQRVGEWKKIVDHSYITSITTQRGSGNFLSEVSSRLSRRFRIVHMISPTRATIDATFGTVFKTHFSVDEMGTEIGGIINKLHDATINLWDKVYKKFDLKPSSECYYYFTCRDLFKVLEGMIRCDRHVISNRDYMIRLWIHECERVFTDCLSTAEDQDFVHSSIVQVLEDSKLNAFLRPIGNVRPDTTLSKDSPRVPRTAGSHPSRGQNRSISFEPGSATYFWRCWKDPEVDQGGTIMSERRTVYELASGGLDGIRKKILEVEKYESIRKSETVLFPYAIGQILKILRVITTRQGNCLLVGRAGTGKKNLTRLAAYLASQQLITLITARGWSEQSLENDLKMIFKATAIENKEITCLVTNSYHEDAAFIERISPFFGSGEISDLMPKDTLSDLLSSLEEAFTNQGQNTSKSALYESLAKKLRANLHFVFSYSPDDGIVKMLQRLPPLCKFCHLIYFVDWSSEMMQEVAKIKLEDINVHLPDAKMRLEALPSFMVTIYNNIKKITGRNDDYLERGSNITTQIFLDFLSHFSQLCCSQSQALALLIQQLDNGLEAIRSANEDILTLQGDIEDSEVILNDSQKLTVDMLKNISTRSIADDRKKAELQSLRSILQNKGNAVETLKAEIDNDILAARPFLDEANNAIQQITQKDLQALKGLKSPPLPVKVVLDGLLILLHKPLSRIQVVEEKGQTSYKDSFSNAAAIMFEPGFVETLQSYAVQNVTDECIELLLPYVNGPLFQFDAVKRVSAVATGVYLWISAIISYHVALKALRPKMVILSSKEKDFREYEKSVMVVQSAVIQAQEEVDFMQSQLVQAIEEKKRLQDEIDVTTRKMQAAKALIISLASQETRWKEESQKCVTRQSKLIGDCAVAAVFLTFCGPLRIFSRDKILQDAMSSLEERRIEFTHNLDVVEMFAENNDKVGWKSQSLLVHSLAMQNIILFRRAIRWPVVIDPHGQGLQWIMLNEKSNDVKYVLGEKQFREIAEECMTTGKPLVIEYAGNGWNQIISSVVAKSDLASERIQGHKFMLDSGKEIECDANFRLYVITWQSAVLSAESSSRVSIVDYTLDSEGLIEQMLNFVIQNERPDLLVQRKTILSEVSSLGKKLKTHQEDILSRLSTSYGNVLNDGSLVEFLGAALKTTAETKESLKRSTETADSVLRAYDEFRKIAELGALLYGLNAEMGRADPIYSSSLDQFMTFFRIAMQGTSKDVMSSKKVNAVVEELTLSTSRFILGGFFQRHRDVFLLLLAFRLQIANSQAIREQVDCFLSGGTGLTYDLVRRKPYNWIPDSTWAICAQSSMTIPQLKELPESIQRLGDQWRAWCDADAPELIPFPDISSVPAAKMDRLNKLILVRAFRVDRIPYAMRQYLGDTLGEQYLSPRTSMIESLYHCSAPKIPLLCILSAGADPNEAISVLSKKLKKNVRFVSAGMDQEATARRHLDTAISLGHWFVLENAHVNPSFLMEIQHHLRSIGSTEPDFRFWMTAYPQSSIPLAVAQMSIKISFEAPTGIRTYLDRCESIFGADFEESCSWTFKSLILSLCVFHCIIHERAKYGSIGWSVPYESHHLDFLSCAKFFIQSIGDNDGKRLRDAQWQKIKYMISEIEISGQFANEWDRRIISSYCECLFNPAVLEPNYLIFKDLSISLPTESSQSFRHTIERLDIFDDPENIGLFVGAAISKNAQDAQIILDTLANVLHGDLTSHVKGLPSQGSAESTLSDLRERIPVQIGEVELKSCFMKDGGPFSPVNIVFQQEVNHINHAIDVVTSTLKSLKTSNGLNFPDREENLKDILLNKIPSSWGHHFWVATTISNWFGTLLLRYDQFKKWLEKGRPLSYWLGGLQRPSALISATKQEIARKYAGVPGWTLEDVVLFTEVTKSEIADIKNPAEDGLYVHNVFLHGCGWNRKDSKLIEITGKSVSSPLPVVYIGAVQRALLKYDYPFVECPLITTKLAFSTPPICSICLRLEENPAKWILRGIVATCLKE